METPTTTPAATGVTHKPWGLPAVLLALLLPVLLWGSSLAIALSSDTSAELSEGELIVGLVVTVLVLDGLFIGLAAGLSLRRYKLGWRELGFRPLDRNFWWLPPVAAVGSWIAVIAYIAILAAFGAEANQEEVEELFESRAVLPLTGVAIVLAAPLAEEIFFRGFIFAGLLRPFGLAGAMVASGFLFAIFHVTGSDTLGLVLPFGLIGMLFAWLYYRTGSLWASIAAHLIFNLVSFFFLTLASLTGNGAA